MQTYLFYDATGAILRMQTYSFVPESAFIAANTPSGQTAMLAPAGHAVLADPQGWQFVGGALVAIVPTAAALLLQAQQAQLAVLSASAAAAITSGFTSSALGSPHRYPSLQVDQLNLTASVVASTLPGTPSNYTTLFYCAAGSPEVWAFTPHTAAQIQQVGVDAKAWIQAQQATHAILAAQAAAASTISAVQAIVWP